MAYVIELAIPASLYAAVVFFLLTQALEAR